MRSHGAQWMQIEFPAAPRRPRRLLRSHRRRRRRLVFGPCGERHAIALPLDSLDPDLAEAASAAEIDRILATATLLIQQQTRAMCCACVVR